MPGSPGIIKTADTHPPARSVPNPLYGIGRERNEYMVIELGFRLEEQNLGPDAALCLGPLARG